MALPAGSTASCRCGSALEVCVKCWNPACPAPLCFSCLLGESGMSEQEVSDLVALVRPLRSEDKGPGSDRRIYLTR
jgi:hypothetical protein